LTRQLVSGSGEGQHTEPAVTSTGYAGARARVQSTAWGSGISGL